MARMTQQTTVTFEKGKRYIVYGRRRGGALFNYDGRFLGEGPGLSISDEDRFIFEPTDPNGPRRIFIPKNYVTGADEL